MRQASRITHHGSCMSTPPRSRNAWGRRDRRLPLDATHCRQLRLEPQPFDSSIALLCSTCHEGGMEREHSECAQRSRRSARCCGIPIQVYLASTTQASAAWRRPWIACSRHAYLAKHCPLRAPVQRAVTNYNRDLAQVQAGLSAGGERLLVLRRPQRLQAPALRFHRQQDQSRQDGADGVTS